MLDMLAAASTFGAAIPNISPEQPPGTDGLTKALNWLSWIIIIMGVAGFLVSAGTLAFAALTGREFNSAKGLFLSIIVCILAVSAGVILQAFL